MSKQICHFGMMLLGVMACGQPGPSRPNSVRVNQAIVTEQSLRLGIAEAAAALRESGGPALRKAPLALLKLQNSTQLSCQEMNDEVQITGRLTDTNRQEIATPSRQESIERSLEVEVKRTFQHSDEDIDCERNEPLLEVDLDDDIIGLTLLVTSKSQEKLLKSLTQWKAVEKKEGPEEEQEAQDIPPPSSEGQMNEKRQPGDEAKKGDSADATPALEPVTVKSEIQSTSDEERQVTWNGVQEEGRDIVHHEKTSSGNSTRKETVKEDGADPVETNFMIKSQFQLVDSYREADDEDVTVGLGPYARLISSGTVSAEGSDGSTSKTTITNLKVDWSTGACRVQSGQVVMEVKGDIGMTRIEYDASTGRFTVKSDAEDVESLSSFELGLCSLLVD